MASLSSLARRAGWNVADQALSALGNMLLMFVVARAVDDVEFGAFAIGFLVFGIAVAVSKAFVGQPLQIRHSADHPERFRRTVADAQGTTAWLGIAFGIGCAVVGLLLGGSLGAVLLAVAACLPGLLVQDTYRMAFFASGAAHHAALIDLVKTVVMFGMLFALLAAGVDDVGPLTLSWGVAASVSAAVGAWVLGAWPGMRSARGWMRRQRDLTGYLLAEYTLGLGAAQLGTLLVPVLGKQSDAGAIRGAQTLLGPLNVLGQAGFAFAVPEVSRHAHMAPARRVRAMLAVSGALGLVSACYAGVLLVLPDSIGRELFGASWAGARSVLLPMSINAVASGLGVGPGSMLLGMGLARKTFRLNLAKAPIYFVLLVPGTLMYGAVGAAWAMAISESVLLPFWALTAWRAAHGRYAPAPDRAVPAEGEPTPSGRV